MVNFKKFVKCIIGSTLVFGLVGCGGADQNVEEVADAKEEFGNDVLNVYNWGEYISEDAIPTFEKMYNCKVNYDLFESNEIMYTKLLGGNSYDVLVPSDYMIERLIKEDMLQKLDLDAIPNLEKINPQVLNMRKTYDPTGEYSVPYFWGSVGIVYNKDVVDPAIIEEKGWDILHDSTYEGRVFGYDSQRDMFMIALKALGYSMNTEDPKELEEAYNWLLEMNEKIKPAYVTDEVIDGMANGDMDMAIMYSGDAAYVLSENPQMAWIEPSQGTNLWSDGMVVPKNASNPKLAMAFINFMASYEESYANSETVGYTASNLQAMEELAKTDYDDNAAYVPRSGYDLDEVFMFNEKINKEQAELWTKVKMSN